MLKRRIKGQFLIIFLLMISSLLLSSCAQTDINIDPGAWGFESTVIYDVLGGTINNRDRRETYYLPNSYLFEPAGTTNLLIRPVRDGYILAGWYRAKEDILDNNGQVIGYRFRSEDRWDFDLDRVQGDMTLYARWIEQARVEYIDAADGLVRFSKNITADSPVQKLSSAAESLITPAGYTLFGYFEDQACTIPYDFASYVHADLVPGKAEVYARLQEEFPDYLRRSNNIPPRQPDNEEEIESNPDHYLNLLGYEMTTDDAAVRAMIRTRKDQIYEEAIEFYMQNSADKTVYLKFLRGNFLRVSSKEDLRNPNGYGFTGFTADGLPLDGYILESDLDFAGNTMLIVDRFSGTIYGNGHKLQNISIRMSSRRFDYDTSKQAALFLTLEGAGFYDMIFENFSVILNVNPRIQVTAGTLALQASGTTLQNVVFDGITIETGRGDDGAALYVIYDLFQPGAGNNLTAVTGTGIRIDASEYARINRYFAAEVPPVN